MTDPRNELILSTEKIKEAAFQRVDLMSSQDIKQANMHLAQAYACIERRKSHRRSER